MYFERRQMGQNHIHKRIVFHYHLFGKLKYKKTQKKQLTKESRLLNVQKLKNIEIKIMSYKLSLSLSNLQKISDSEN